MALFNNGYPASYQQMYAPQLYPNSTPTQPQQGGLIWVQGDAGAKSYLVAPNTTVALFDSEAQTIYLKSADASGMPSIKTLDYTIREMPSPVKAPSVEYATKAELEEIRKALAELKKEEA